MVVGVDIVEIGRLEGMLTRYRVRLLERVFTEAEVAYCRGRVAELAARFAAKEAVSKALGVGMRMLARDGIEWQDVEVVGDARGKPRVRLSGRAAERAAELGVVEWEISLAHTVDTAIAVVIAQ